MCRDWPDIAPAPIVSTFRLANAFTNGITLLSVPPSSANVLRWSKNASFIYAICSSFQLRHCYHTDHSQLSSEGGITARYRTPPSTTSTPHSQPGSGTNDRTLPQLFSQIRALPSRFPQERSISKGMNLGIGLGYFSQVLKRRLNLNVTSTKTKSPYRVCWSSRKFLPRFPPR